MLEVGVVEDHIGRLATELEGNGLDGLSRQLAHPLASTRRARERHHVDVGVGGDGLAHDGAGACYQVEHARREPDIVDDLSEDEGVEGRDLAGLQDDRAAGRERRRHLVGDLVERIVPRRDGADDADRLLDHERVAELLLPLDLVDQLLHRTEGHGGKAGLDDHRQVDRHAQLLGDDVGDVHRAGLQPFGDALDVLRPLLGRGRRPRVEGALGRLYGLVDVVRCGLGHTAHDFLGSGIDHVDRC